MLWAVGEFEDPHAVSEGIRQEHRNMNT